ncbi:MAG: shikimate kinase [Polyangiaceae bacterium]
MDRPAKEPLHPLLTALGERARARRRELGLSLRELALASEISERFLISLEAGQANVSVVRLADLARALETTMVALLEDPLQRDAHASSPAPAAALHRSISLVGLRGAGKSTVGARAAAELGVPFVELDARITGRAGLGAGEIFDLHGFGHYRRLEREELERLVTAEPPCIFATAGSIVTEHATYERLLATTTVVWLKAAPEDHLGRVAAQGDQRPMADRKDAMKELRSILRSRRALYERAHHTIDTSKVGLSRAVRELVRLARHQADID